MNSKLSTPGGGINCETCQAQLADYVRIELGGQAADEANPEVAFHIETCKDCEAAYYREFRSQGQRMSVTELRQVGDRSQVAKAMQEILSEAQPPWKTVADGTRKFVHMITAQIELTRSIFTIVPSMPQVSRQLVPRPTLLGGEDSDWIETLKLEDQEKDIAITLAVSPRQASTGTVKILVTSSEPIERAWVSLYEGETLLEANHTAADGTVTFQELEPGDYTFKIKHDQQEWELPFRLQVGSSDHSPSV